MQPMTLVPYQVWLLLAVLVGIGLWCWMYEPKEPSKGFAIEGHPKPHAGPCVGDGECPCAKQVDSEGRVG